VIRPREDKLEARECNKACRVYWAYLRSRATFAQAQQALADVQACFITGAWRKAL
jgi:hypothetical protein